MSTDPYNLKAIALYLERHSTKEEAALLRQAAAEIERLRAIVGANVGALEVPSVGERVTLTGTIIGVCSIYPPPWISIRFDGGNELTEIYAPFKSVRIQQRV